jgi:hypothetical protein
LSLPFNKTINDTEDFKACVEDCDLNSNYKFLNNITSDTGGTSFALYCNTTCSGSNKRYLKSNYKCIEKCPEPNNFILKNEDDPIECLNKCPNDKQYARLEDGEYICSDTECGNGSEDATNNQEYYY